VYSLAISLFCFGIFCLFVLIERERERERKRERGERERKREREERERDGEREGGRERGYEIGRIGRWGDLEDAEEGERK
jgi:hypothetical protein